MNYFSSCTYEKVATFYFYHVTNTFINILLLKCNNSNSNIINNNRKVVAIYSYNENFR